MGSYGVGTSLMGYASGGDKANVLANRYGIGYVVSDRYGNGSFWSSFPDKTYVQSSLGKAVKAEPGKIYASILWSDGDNISFDQTPLYKFWHDPNRGTIPVTTLLSPTLQELNSPLLDWYYSKMTTNDELVAGAVGVQFIYLEDFNSDLVPAWCRLNREWCQDAGFHYARTLLDTDQDPKSTTHLKTCGLAGIFGKSGSIQPLFPPSIGLIRAGDETNFFDKLTSAVMPNPQRPRFVSFLLTVQHYDKRNAGYTAVKRRIDRVEEACPGRYVFLLPKDQFATLRAFYHMRKGHK